MDAYKKGLALAPDNPGIERDMADLYFQSGSLSLAKAKYEALLKQNPDDPYVLKRLQEINRRAR
jgi:hypothetical protein